MIALLIKYIARVVTDISPFFHGCKNPFFTCIFHYERGPEKSPGK